MRLKKLEVFGFKSFCEKTVVSFQPGINAIVGPNGCGKSNIVDAILWAMGEQSAKTLRGDRMEDVLFNGSPERKPLGMAEATLTISGIQGELPAVFSGHSEVEITRRLFRSGESEYLIHKVPCRLKDVRDLLIDAGAGFKGHTIIEQGRIDQILQASPVDRRAIIEEAAGILKYRVRKNEALRKLEATEQNLLRVRDIISEVRRQINALERQAQKAKRQAEILGEIKRVEVTLLGRKYSDYHKTWEDIRKRGKTLEDDETERTAGLSSAEATVQSLQLSRLESDQDLSRTREALLLIDKETHRLQGRLEVLQNQMESCEAQKERLLRTITENEHEGAQLHDQWEQGETLKEGLAKALSQAQENLSARETAFQSMTKDFHEARTALEEARIRLFAKVTNMTETKNRVVAIQSRLEEEGRRRLRIESERSDSSQSLSQTQTNLTLEEKERSQIADDLSRLQEEQATLVQTLRSSEEALHRLSLALSGTREDLNRREARYHSLSEIEKNLIGYQEGARAILLSQKENSDALSGIHGLIAHLIETQPAYEKAIEAVLGERLQHMVVENPSAGREAVGFLKKRGSGRGTFIPIHLDTTLGQDNDALYEDLGTHEGVIGPASRLITYPESYRVVLHHLLHDVWVVENMDVACRLWERHQTSSSKGRPVWVTLEGEVMDSFGILTGGDTNSGLPNLISKRREMKTLEREIQNLQGEIARLAQHLEGQTVERDSVKAQLEAAEQGVHHQRLQLAHKEKDIQVLLDLQTRMELHLGTLSREAEETERSQTVLLSDLHEIQIFLRDQEDQKISGEEELTRLQERQLQVSHEWEASQQDLLAVKTHSATLTEKLQSQGQLLENVSRRHEALLVTNRDRHSEVIDINQKKSAFHTEREAIEKDLEGLHSRGGLVRHEIREKEGLQSELLSQIHNAEGHIRVHRDALDQLRSQKGQMEVKLAELRIEMDHIQEYLTATYRIPVEECLAQLPDAVSAETSEVTVEEPSGPADALESLNIELTDWKERLQRLGPVNPAAVEEFQELQTRFDFMTQQEADLTEACDTLQQTINKINQTTREMFLDAFHALNQNFQMVFQKLFREGSARLVLTDESKVLESGIDIEAHPSGKTVSHLSLLSGGEKALTAIALLFGSFLVRPTPFCVLDEIDAPLDEANTGRFIEALKSMTDRSQFIVITHNKRTMEAADVLYGVTMEEPGISKVLSVQLSRETQMEPETVAA